MPASPSPSRALDAETPEERSSGVLLIVIGVLAALSVVIAALVIFSSGGSPARTPEAAAQVRAGQQSVIVGKDSAGTKVVIYEDFASPESRELAIASRDFLKIEAARGIVEVEYRPISVEDDAYSRQAITAWAGVLRAGTPSQALTFHDALIDRQPDPGSDVMPELRSWARDEGIHDADVLDAVGAMDVEDSQLVAKANRAAADAGVTRTPTVLVDGDAVTAASPTALADKLQRLLLQRD